MTFPYFFEKSHFYYEPRKNLGFILCIEKFNLIAIKCGGATFSPPPQSYDIELFCQRVFFFWMFRESSCFSFPCVSVVVVSGKVRRRRRESNEMPRSKNLRGPSTHLSPPLEYSSSSPTTTQRRRSFYLPTPPPPRGRWKKGSLMNLPGRECVL
jgi:hypothetical protein